MQNFPNPFNPNTAINYQLPAVSQVKIAVYNVLGQEIQTLVNRRQEAGNHSVVFYAGNLAGGVYYYKLTAGSFVQVRKMILVK